MSLETSFEKGECMDMSVVEPSVTKLWEARQVAETLGVSLSWVRRATARGELPSMKFGGVRRYHPAVIAEWIENHKRGK